MTSRRALPKFLLINSSSFSPAAKTKEGTRGERHLIPGPVTCKNEHEEHMADRSQYRVKFKTCQHDWELDVDVEACGGKAAGNGIFQCEKCGTFVTLLEKVALDSLISQKESQGIQERHTKISMWANIIAAVTLMVSFFSLLFGNAIIGSETETFYQQRRYTCTT